MSNFCDSHNDQNCSLCLNSQQLNHCQALCFDTSLPEFESYQEAIYFWQENQCQRQNSQDLNDFPGCCHQHNEKYNLAEFWLKLSGKQQLFFRDYFKLKQHENFQVYNELTLRYLEHYQLNQEDFIILLTNPLSLFLSPLMIMALLSVNFLFVALEQNQLEEEKPVTFGFYLCPLITSMIPYLMSTQEKIEDKLGFQQLKWAKLILLLTRILEISKLVHYFPPLQANWSELWYQHFRESEAYSEEADPYFQRLLNEIKQIL